MGDMEPPQEIQQQIQHARESQHMQQQVHEMQQQVQRQDPMQRQHEDSQDRQALAHGAVSNHRPSATHQPETKHQAHQPSGPSLTAFPPLGSEPPPKHVEEGGSPKLASTDEETDRQKTRAERRAERNAHREHEPRSSDRPLPRRPPRHLMHPGPPAADSEQLDEMLNELVEGQRQPEEERLLIKQCFDEMEQLVHRVFHEEFQGRVRLHIFGSCVNGFGMKDADVDMCLQVPTESHDEAAQVVEKLAEAIRTYFPDAGDDADLDDPNVDSNAIKHSDILALTHARVPIVKIHRMPRRLRGIACDVCVNNLLAVVNTQLLKDYASIDPRLSQLAFCVKHWARRRKVNSTYHGTLSSYCYVIMCIYYLQTRKPPILPCLQDERMLKPTFSATINGITCSYHKGVSILAGFGSANSQSVSELLTGFFDYWAYRHDYSRDVASIRVGTAITKQSKEWTTRVGKDRHLICVEDPFDLSHDLGRTVDRNSIGVLRDEFIRATRIMREEHDAKHALDCLFERYEPPPKSETQTNS